MMYPTFSYATLAALWSRWQAFKTHEHFSRSTTKTFGLFVALIYPFVDIPNDIIIEGDDQVAYNRVLRDFVGHEYA